MKLQRERAAPGQAEEVRRLNADVVEQVEEAAGVVLIEKSSGVSLDCPHPGASHAMTSKSRLKSSICVRQTRPSAMKPCRRTSVGPVPLRR
jgi:hypothetical protein